MRSHHPHPQKGSQGWELVQGCTRSPSPFLTPRRCWSGRSSLGRRAGRRACLRLHPTLSTAGSSSPHLSQDQGPEPEPPKEEPDSAGLRVTLMKGACAVSTAITPVTGPVHATSAQE